MGRSGTSSSTFGGFADFRRWHGESSRESVRALTSRGLRAWVPDPVGRARSLPYLGVHTAARSWLRWDARVRIEWPAAPTVIAERDAHSHFDDGDHLTVGLRCSPNGGTADLSSAYRFRHLVTFPGTPTTVASQNSSSRHPAPIVAIDRSCRGGPLHGAVRHRRDLRFRTLSLSISPRCRSASRADERADGNAGVVTQRN